MTALLGMVKIAAKSVNNTIPNRKISLGRKLQLQGSCGNCNQLGRNIAFWRDVQVVSQ